MHTSSSNFQVAASPSRRRACIALLLAAAGLALSPAVTTWAQSIQPVISEYTGTADGKFELTNNTLTPMAVVLEPKSFSIGPNGRGAFRGLDPTTHVDLSTMSVVLEPQQTYYVFYKAHSDTLPAWFTVYAVFSPVKKDEQVKVRVMLPHTVYLYQKKPFDKEAVDFQHATYLAGQDTVVFDLDNLSPALVRVAGIRVVGGKSSVDASGFPLLPHSPRHLEIPWKETNPPSYVVLHFPHFDLKEPLSAESQ
jgi:hypothetical protein